MCTVTIVSPEDGQRHWRLACNRDEKRRRQSVLAPQRQGFGTRQAVLPIDPASGGTWVAVNDAGLALALLNVNRRPQPSGPVSRGCIIPELLHCDTAETAAALAASIDPARHSPFRLIVVDDDHVADLLSDGATLLSTHLELRPGPHLFTSSSLGDHLVEPPRRRLFEQTLAARPTAASQDAYHYHRWPERPHLSVCMSRDDAHTVSYCVIEWRVDAVGMICQGGSPDVQAERVEVELPLRKVHDRRRQVAGLSRTAPAVTTLAVVVATLASGPQ